MMDLREKIARELFDQEGQTPGESHVFEHERGYWLECADRILAIPEIADALKLVPVKPLNLGPSVSTGKRDPV